MSRFFSAFDVLPGWAWGIWCACLIAAHLVAGNQLKDERLAHQATKAQHAIVMAQAESAAREQSEQYRAKEQELLNAQDTLAREVAALQSTLERSRAAARDAAGRLRRAAQDAAARARAQCAAPALADIRQAADDPIGLLADVLGRADDRAGILAEIADRRGIAGRACERLYDEARQALKD